MLARADPNRFGQNAGDIFGAPRWIVEPLAQSFPSHAIRTKEDCAQLGERLVCTVGGHGIGERQLVGARYLKLIGKPEGNLIEQSGQRGAIGLGVL